MRLPVAFGEAYKGPTINVPQSRYINQNQYSAAPYNGMPPPSFIPSSSGHSSSSMSYFLFTCIV